MGSYSPNPGGFVLPTKPTTVGLGLKEKNNKVKSPLFFLDLSKKKIFPGVNNGNNTLRKKDLVKPFKSVDDPPKTVRVIQTVERLLKKIPFLKSFLLIYG